MENETKTEISMGISLIDAKLNNIKDYGISFFFSWNKSIPNQLEYTWLFCFQNLSKGHSFINFS